MSNELVAYDSPAAASLALAEAQGQTSYLVGILQVSGRYLDIVYQDSETAPTPAGLAVAVKLATIRGRRLASAG